MKHQKSFDPKPSRRPLSRGRILVLIIAVLVFIGCGGGYLLYEVILPQREAHAYADLARKLHANDAPSEPNVPSGETPTEKTSADNAPADGTLPKYTAILQENADLRGWLSVPVLNLDLPVVQGPDNEYYLRRSFTGEWSVAGTPFFDSRIADLRDLPRNTVVYGHNMRRTDMMFGAFQKLRTVEGFQSCPAIDLGTIWQDRRWFVYAVFITNIDPAQDNGYFFPYNFIDATDEEFADYLREIDLRKFYTTGVDLTPQDKLLTISTCCYDFSDARLVVVAREKRENEPDLPDTSKAYANPAPKYPQVWYDEHGTVNPYLE